MNTYNNLCSAFLDMQAEGIKNHTIEQTDEGRFKVVEYSRSLDLFLDIITFGIHYLYTMDQACQCLSKFDISDIGAYADIGIEKLSSLTTAVKKFVRRHHCKSSEIAQEKLGDLAIENEYKNIQDIYKRLPCWTRVNLNKPSSDEIELDSNLYNRMKEQLKILDQKSANTHITEIKTFYQRAMTSLFNNK